MLHVGGAVAVSMPMPNSRTGNNRHNAHKLPDMSSMGKTLLTDHEARTAEAGGLWLAQSNCNLHGVRSSCWLNILQGRKACHHGVLSKIAAPCKLRNTADTTAKHYPVLHWTGPVVMPCPFHQNASEGPPSAISLLSEDPINRTR